MPRILKIDRSAPFDLSRLPWPGVYIGEEDGMMSNITEVDLDKVELLNVYEPEEERLSGMARFMRVKMTGELRLDIQTLFALLDNQDLIPEGWRPHSIVLDGTVLVNESGGQCSLLMTYIDGQWKYHAIDLAYGLPRGVVSAVLPTKPHPNL